MCPSPHNCKLDQHYYDSPKRGPSLWLPHSDTPWITSISARCSRWRWCIGASNSRESGSLSFVHSRHTRVHYACNMCLPPRPVSRRAMGTTIIATSFRDNNVPIMTMLLRLPTLWPRPRRVVGWIALFSSWKSIGTPCGGREGNKAKMHSAPNGVCCCLIFFLSFFTDCLSWREVWRNNRSRWQKKVRYASIDLDNARLERMRACVRFATNVTISDANEEITGSFNGWVCFVFPKISVIVFFLQCRGYMFHSRAMNCVMDEAADSWYVYCCYFFLFGKLIR